MQTRHWNIAIGLFLIALSLFTLIWWIPTDIESGILVEEFRDISIGDAMAPTACAIAVLIFSVALVVSSVLAGRTVDGVDGANASPEPKIGISKSNVRSIAAMAAILATSLAIMVWAGPLLVQLLQAAGSDIKSYRLLTSTVPHKYTGFALGGLVLVTGLISWIEGHISLRAIAIAISAVLLLIAVYDIPFDTLLLPPNGEQ